MTICRLSALGISSIPFVEQLKSFSVKQVRDVILKYDESLKSYCENLNSLNVYPVPDGDTGTNMLLTLRSLDLSDSKTIDVENFLSTLKNSSLMEARGNSGVILSQFFIGLLAAYKKNNSLT